MKAKLGRIGKREALPRLESLESRLALSASGGDVLMPAVSTAANADLVFAQLVPIAGSEQTTLKIDMGAHAVGNDGVLDTLFLTRSSGRVELYLEGRARELLFADPTGSVGRIDFTGSNDSEILLVEDGLTIPVAFEGGGGFNRLVPIGVTPTPPPVVVPTIPIRPNPSPALPYGEDGLPTLPFEDSSIVVDTLPVDYAFAQFDDPLDETTPEESDDLFVELEEDRTAFAGYLLTGPLDEEFVRFTTPSGGGHIDKQMFVDNGVLVYADLEEVDVPEVPDDAEEPEDPEAEVPAEEAVVQA